MQQANQTAAIRKLAKTKCHGVWWSMRKIRIVSSGRVEHALEETNVVISMTPPKAVRMTLPKRAKSPIQRCRTSFRAWRNLKLQGRHRHFLVHQQLWCKMLRGTFSASLNDPRGSLKQPATSHIEAMLAAERLGQNSPALLWLQMTLSRMVKEYSGWLIARNRLRDVFSKAHMLESSSMSIMSMGLQFASSIISMKHR